MSKQCYYCSGLPQDHEVKGEADCPKINPRVMDVWERGYNDALEKKGVTRHVSATYIYGYNRGEEELRKIHKGL